MALFSGIYISEEGNVVDEEHGLTLQCSTALATTFFLQDQDIVGGNHAALPGDMNVITNIRTINFRTASDVISERRPESTRRHWWEDEFEASEDEEEEAPEDFEEAVEQVEEEPEPEPEPEPERTNLRRNGFGIPPRTINVVGAGSGGRSLHGYADMVNRTMAWEATHDRMFSSLVGDAEASEASPLEDLDSSGITEAVEVADRTVENARRANPQRRPNILRGGRRRW